MKKKTIAAEMAMAQIAIENALQQPTIQKKLAAVGYDRKTLLAGKSLSEEVRMLQSVQQDKYGEQYRSLDAFRQQMAEVQGRYQRHLKIARLAFADQRGRQEQLQMVGKRKIDISGMLEQMNTFYKKISLFASEMALYNTNPDELTQTQAMVAALYAARQRRLQYRGEAQDATQKRDEKRKQLRAWMSRFKKAARLALHDDPQLLEALGIVVASQKV